ncbi:hypothetical protein ACWIB8_10105, partial [Corynebacterium flavescens]
NQLKQKPQPKMDNDKKCIAEKHLTIYNDAPKKAPSGTHQPTKPTKAQPAQSPTTKRSEKIQNKKYIGTLLSSQTSSAESRKPQISKSFNFHVRVTYLSSQEFILSTRC